MNKVQIFLVAINVIITLILVTLVRKSKLREKYIAIWIIGLITSFFGIVFSSFLQALTLKLGFVLLSNFVFVFVIIFILLQDLYQSVELTKSEKRHEITAFRIAELEMRIRKLEDRN